MNILSFIARYDIYIIIMYTLWATDDLYAIIALQLDLRKFMILKSCKIILFFFSNIIFLSFSYFETTDKHTSIIFLAFQIFFKFFFFFFTIRSIDIKYTQKFVWPIYLLFNEFTRPFRIYHLRPSLGLAFFHIES